MKKFLILITVVMSLAIVTSVFAGRNGMKRAFSSTDLNQTTTINQTYPNSRQSQMPLLVQTLPYEELSETEANSLIFMVEEEKLARDVYLALGEKWGLIVFANIASSEQSHMDAIISLMEKYGLETSFIGDRGVFNNEELQTLYNNLIEQGNESAISALTVGATIEDVDIKDLETYTQAVDNQDITLVFQNLTKGSRNHLRAFVRNLEYYGASYTPQFISQEEFDYIISSPMEKGMLR
jgi:hypothetical protein